MGYKIQPAVTYKLFVLTKFPKISAQMCCI